MGNTSKSKTKIIIQFLNLGNGDFLTLLIFFSPAISSLEGAVTRALWSAPSVLSPAPCSRARPGSGRHQSHRPARTDRLSPVLWTGTLTFVVLKTLINSDQEMWVNRNMQASSSRFPGIPLGSEWSTDPQKGVSIVLTPTPFSVQSLLWLWCPYCSLTARQGFGWCSLQDAAFWCLLLGLGGASPVAQR